MFVCGVFMVVSEFLLKQFSYWNVIRVSREIEEDGVEYFSDVRDDEDEINEGIGLFEGDKMMERMFKVMKSDSEKFLDDDEDVD